LRALSLCTCCRHYPGTATGGTASLIRPVISAFPERVVGSACASTFSRLTQRSLALRPAHSRCHQIVARLPEGFRHFVTSMPAPVASGWSGCRVGLAPTGKRRLFTAHTHCQNPTHCRRSRQTIADRRCGWHIGRSAMLHAYRATTPCTASLRRQINHAAASRSVDRRGQRSLAHRRHRCFGVLLSL
jgi:hypothetical protein